MEKHRRQHVDKIRSDITILEKAQARDNGIKVKSDTITSNINRRDRELEELRNKERSTILGYLDDEISGEFIEGTKGKKIRMDVKQVKRTYDKNDDFSMGRDFKYFYRRFCEIGNELPDFIRRNLAEMPNNKGYIWKGCWFLGDLPSEKNQPTIMFEKMRDGISRIHEYYPHEYRLYERVGKEKKKLVQKKKRKLMHK